MRTLLWFVLAAVCFEVVALTLISSGVAQWLLVVVICALAVFLLGLAARGWRRQQRLDLPPVQTGQVVRRRHWRLF
jgi:membrane protein implicated in regulation of membrane protease activity